MRININIPDYLNDRLKEIAKKECMPRQAVIIWLLKAGLKRYERLSEVFEE